MTAASKIRAKRHREWAASLTPMQRRLFVVLANDVMPAMQARATRFDNADLASEAVDLQRRLDACRKVERWGLSPVE